MDPDAVDISVIESSKENIQTLASGRSARALAQVYSGSSEKGAPQARAFGTLQPVLTPSHQEALNDERRAEFERELAEEFEDSDDPLDIYDRYVKWTLLAYPTGQATAASGLLPLLERATQPFVSSPQYANDPRYLKLWLLYIQFFSDNVQETFRFLAQNEIGSSLALFYEEYAGWLESEGRWVQAEEIYLVGIDNNARPVERLRRKYHEFQQRFEQRPTDGPRSPAIPSDRPALALRNAASSGSYDPQAESRSRAAAAAAAAAKPKKSKMMIFSDTDAPAQDSRQGPTAGIPKWDSLSSVQNRRKENTQEATAWTGVTLKGGKKAPGPKIEVFRDEVKQGLGSRTSRPPRQDDGRNALSGKRERVYVNLNCLSSPRQDESCFEEVWAQHRGWLDIDWEHVRAEKAKKRRELQAQKARAPLSNQAPFATPREPRVLSSAHGASFQTTTARPTFQPFHEEENKRGHDRGQDLRHQYSTTPAAGRALAPKPIQPFRDEDGENDENRGRRGLDFKPRPGPRNVDEREPDENNENNENAVYESQSRPQPSAQSRARAAKRAQRREDQDNRTTKIEVRHVEETTTTTIPANLGSPVAPRIRRKKVTGRKNAVQEPTMTLQTKEAMNEIYGIFSAPLKGEQSGGADEGEEDLYGDGGDSDDDDDDDDEHSDDTGSVSGSGESENEDDFTSGAESTYTTKTDAGSVFGSELDNGEGGRARRWSGSSENARVVMKSGDEMTDVIDDRMDDVGADSEHPFGSYDEGEDDVDDDDDVMRDIHATPGRGSSFGVGEYCHEDGDSQDENQRLPVVNPYRVAGYGRRLPFMTPIVERTESSIRLGTTGRTIRTGDRRGWTETKTPSRTGRPGLSSVGKLGELAGLPALPEMPNLDEIDLDEGVCGEEVTESDLEMGSPGSKGLRQRKLSPMTPRLAVYRDDEGSRESVQDTRDSDEPVQSQQNNEDGPLGTLDLDRLRDALPDGTAKQDSPFQIRNNLSDSRQESKPEPAPHALHPTRQPTQPALIPDTLCNPLDLSIRRTIIEAAQPPFAQWPGFYDHGKTTRKGAAEIARGLRSAAGSGGAGHRLVLEGSRRDYLVRQELGRGTFAPVYLVQSVAGAGEDGPNSDRSLDRLVGVRYGLEAVKLESPASVWEFYILRLARMRLASLQAASPSRPSSPNLPEADSASLSALARRALPSIVPAHELHLFADESYLIEQFRPEGTLLDIINAVRSDVLCAGGAAGGGSTAVGDEIVALFFATEVVRAVEGLHAAGILHGDLKVDNVLVRFGESQGRGGASAGCGGSAGATSPFVSGGRQTVGSPLGSSNSFTDLPNTSSPFSSPPNAHASVPSAPSPQGSCGVSHTTATGPSSLSSTYSPSGADGWSSVGIQLIDFGRGIDLAAFSPDTAFIADWNTTETDCVEVREMRPWRWQIDYYGLAGIVHTLLYGKYMDVLVTSGSAGGKRGGGGAGGVGGDAEAGASAGIGIGIGDKVYRLRESFKRYWQTEIWNDLFFLLLNPGRYVQQHQQRLQQQVQARALSSDSGKAQSGSAAAAEASSAILAAGLRDCRERMEAVLVQNCRKGEGLAGMLRKLEGRMRMRKR